MKKAVITGATGMIGVALTEYLIKRGIRVTALARPSSHRLNNIPKSPLVRVVTCRLGDWLRVKNILAFDHDAFFHLEWATETRDSIYNQSEQANSILNTRRAVRLAKILGCSVFVGAGSWAEEKRTTPYGLAKYVAANTSRGLCQSLGLRHCWARIYSVYGPHDKPDTAVMYCVNTLLHGNRPILSKGDQLWDYLYVEDCARALYLIAEYGRNGEVYPVASGQSQPLKKYFGEIRDGINPALPLGIGERPQNGEYSINADITVLTRDTGFTPECSFSYGISKTIEWAKRR